MRPARLPSLQGSPRDEPGQRIAVVEQASEAGRLPAGPGAFDALPVEHDLLGWVARLLDRLFNTRVGGR